MTEMHWVGPFRLVPGPPPEGVDCYEPRYTVIAQYLSLAADAILDCGQPLVNAALVRRVDELRGLADDEVEHLLDVLGQAGLVGPPGEGGRRAVLVGRGRGAHRRILAKVHAIAYVAAQLGDEPLTAFPE